MFVLLQHSHSQSILEVRENPVVKVEITKLMSQVLGPHRTRGQL